MSSRALELEIFELEILVLTVLYCTVLYCTVQLQYSTVLRIRDLSS